ncbi:MAG: exosortase-associated protein EpsI, V-type [Candidatus Binatia bacterium]
MKQSFDSFTQPRTERRKFLLGLLFCSAAGVAAWRQPYIRIDYLGAQKLDAILPKTIGPWNFVAASGLVIPPEDEFEKTLYSNLLTRVYSDGQSTPIMLLVAQNGSQTGFLQIHRPEFCYTAGGYHISAVTPHPINLGSRVLTTSRMDASAGGPTEHVVYWTRIGNTVPTSWARQKYVVAKQNLEGIIPDAILIRVSTVNDDAAAAMAAIDQFIRDMLYSIAPSKRSIFIA